MQAQAWSEHAPGGAARGSLSAISAGFPGAQELHRHLAAVEHGASTSINQKTSCSNIGVCECKHSFRVGKIWKYILILNQSWIYNANTETTFRAPGFGNEFLIPSSGPACGTLSSLTDTFELNSRSIQQQLHWNLLDFSERIDQSTWPIAASSQLLIKALFLKARMPTGSPCPPVKQTAGIT